MKDSKTTRECRRNGCDHCEPEHGCKPQNTPMHAKAIGNFLFAARRSSDGLWVSRGRLMRWIHLTIRKDTVNLKIGKWMFGIMWEKNNAGI